MPVQSRRSTNRPTRSQRRAGVQGSRTYSVPAARAMPVPPRRTYAAEPPPVDHSAEFAFIRKDLRRILIWSALILAAMIALAVVYRSGLLF